MKKKKIKKVFFNRSISIAERKPESRKQDVGILLVMNMKKMQREGRRDKFWIESSWCSESEDMNYSNLHQQVIYCTKPTRAGKQNKKQVKYGP